MSWNTDSLLKTCGHHPANREVIAYLTTQHPSAHSDIADELLNAAVACVPKHARRWFCPDTRKYAYVALHLPSESNNGHGDGVIYALAIGMQTVIFRLPEAMPGAIKKQLRPFQEISDDGAWLTFEMFRNGDVAGDRALVRSLTESAYRYAQTLPPAGER